MSVESALLLPQCMQGIADDPGMVRAEHLSLTDALQCKSSIAASSERCNHLGHLTGQDDPQLHGQQRRMGSRS